VTPAKRIEAEASKGEILALIEDTDRLAEIPNSLRLGTPVTLIGAQAIADTFAIQIWFFNRQRQFPVWEVEKAYFSTTVSKMEKSAPESTSARI